MTTSIHHQVEALRLGQDPTLIARLASGWAVLASTQVIAGYSLLLPDPVVSHLNALEGPVRSRFLADMAILGDALLEVTGAVRINYAIFGNVDPALHAHLFPRTASEPEALRTQQPFAHDWTQAPRFDAAAHAALIQRIRAALQQRRALA
jgi:diadenosine tetraphosphate (Ap4A) HIT family hydrolase